MSESYMKKGLEAQKPTEVMAEGLRFYADEFLRWGAGKPAEDTPLILAAVKLMLPLLEGQLGQSKRRMYDVLCRNFSAIGIPNVKKNKNAPAETRTPSGRRPMRGRLSSTPLL